jgi:hypothetical protein
MLVKWSNFKVGIKKSGKAVKKITIVVAIACSILTPLAATAQPLLIDIQAGASAAALPPRVSTTLPVTNLDSFVYQAGGAAANIYGDEDPNGGLPPQYGFDQTCRINYGIVGQNDAGLTTGHGSYMPSATGADEFLASPGEWAWSGPNNGNLNLSVGAIGLTTDSGFGFGTDSFSITLNSGGSWGGGGGLPSLPGVPPGPPVGATVTVGTGP